MVYDILIRTRYDSLEGTSDKLRFGIERLIRNQSYVAYYPIHEEFDYNDKYDPETCSTRKLLYENWVTTILTYLLTYPVLGETKKFL